MEFFNMKDENLSFIKVIHDSFLQLHTDSLPVIAWSVLIGVFAVLALGKYRSQTKRTTSA